ncbi:hypothetical protein DQ04_05691030 [Trypanosoma grayi]|uniref:hypothetical protein n=1 Tax=Trypanosoma grayi TaxID=71804 RepID=UPI0004F47B38|nr:hypothetical protein DQ04_05691030 [Trypanosoma grayi]KEG09167.1 hypothetical protein DQ04_05691030 [Trypanosoma grayi]
MTAALSAMQKATEAESRANLTAEKALAAVKQTQEVTARAKEAASEASAAATNSEVAVKTEEAVKMLTKAVESAVEAAKKARETAAEAQEVASKAKQSSLHAKGASDEIKKAANAASHAVRLKPLGDVGSSYDAWLFIDNAVRYNRLALGLANDTKNGADETTLAAQNMATFAESLKNEYDAALQHIASGKAALDAAREKSQTALKLQTELQNLRKQQHVTEDTHETSPMKGTLKESSADVTSTDTGGTMDSIGESQKNSTPESLRKLPGKENDDTDRNKEVTDPSLSGAAGTPVVDGTDGTLVSTGGAQHGSETQPSSHSSASEKGTMRPQHAEGGGDGTSRPSWVRAPLLLALVVLASLAVC